MTYEQILSVDVAYYTSNIALGGGGGNAFYYGLDPQQGPKSGVVVRSLKAYCDGNTMRGLEVELTDGSKHTFGMVAGTPTDTFYIAEGEKVTSLKLWAGTYLSGRSGGFELTTDQKRTFSVDPPDRIGEPYQPEIGSGILVGVFGKCGNDIDCLGFGLLRRIESAQLINVQYPDISTLLVTTTPREIKTITYDNSEGTTAQTVTLEGSETVDTSESWSVTAGMEVSVVKQTEVKAGIPIIQAVDSKVSVSVTMSVSGRTNMQTTEQAFSFPIKVPPGKRIQATATLYEGDIDTKYTATMVYNLDSGKSFNYKVNGAYSGISVSQIVVTNTALK